MENHEIQCFVTKTYTLIYPKFTTTTPLYLFVLMFTRSCGSSTMPGLGFTRSDNCHGYYPHNSTYFQQALAIMYSPHAYRKPKPSALSIASSKRCSSVSLSWAHTLKLWSHSFGNPDTHFRMFA